MEFEIAPAFNVSITGEQFIHYGNKREEQFKKLATHQSLIHGIYHVRNVVEAYCLLTKRRPETYAEVFRQLEHLTDNIVPHSLMIGSEQGTIATLNQEYHLVPHNLCLFHLSKTI